MQFGSKVKSVAVLGALVAGVGFLYGRHSTPEVEAAAASGPPQSAASSSWLAYGGSNADAQYSSLKQVNRSNVGQLQQVWFYPSGNNGFRYGSNPLVVDGVMFVYGKDNDIAALDATNGSEIWCHHTYNPRLISHRGMAYWESKDRSDRRLIFHMNNEIHELDPRTGKEIATFGKNGAVDLREGLGRDPKSIRQIESGTPGRVFENLYITGSATGEEYESPPGDLRAFDVVTGKLVWQFHTVPHPGEMGYDTWPKDAYKYVGGVNNWGEFSIDEKRGIAYFPLGSPTYDFYGADRKGANLFSDCILALDVRTGKYLWHFQTTHHDLWDYDLMTGPKLLTIQHDGKNVDVVVQAGKNGFVYVLDRTSGTAIWPIEERPVPKSDVPGEEPWPTQPIPTHVPPFARQAFTPEMVNPYIADPKEREAIRKQVAEARQEGIYTPPTLGTTMETPGNNGGANWGSGAVDASTSTFYVMSKDAPSLLHLEAKPPKRVVTGPPENSGMVTYLQNCRACHGVDRKGQPPAIPSLDGVIQRAGADRVRTAVKTGLAPMPAFPDLDDNDIDRLIAYLKSPEKAKIAPDVLTRLMAPPPATASKLGPGGIRYWTGYGYMNSSDGLPAISPPWSSLTAYDMNKGEIKWRIPMGEVAALAEKGITGTGSFWPRGGATVTAGGLIIVPTKSDGKLHFYDKDTGKQLGELSVPAGPEGIPTVYEVAGREYIAISARPNPERIPVGDQQPSEPNQGSAEPAGGKTTQGYYVFALPVIRK
ncbi:PQQ-binding-like beta-propeller repeat protein [Terriglobus albidus]|uniref:PQQ-binding-like beta-propeller repeat protein n=1 Tax=Terriglobus albidus TaxID=1592106 RepID=A0A5B9EDK2_9BACT|nr:PQQ-binding-like beta-propeller repeat protein [Terriglobus albidus]QEE30283.1 PQQ-binding-like beta-propeller repeat protein [Terriglobus albidus]